MIENTASESIEKESDYLIETLIFTPGRKTEGVKPFQIPREDIDNTVVEFFVTIMHGGELYEYRRFHHLKDLMGEPRLVIRKEIPPEIKRELLGV